MADSPSTSTIVETAKQELLALHATHRAAHFATDPAALLSAQAEPFITVANGAIHEVTRQTSLQRFTDYFGGATYHEWDDLQPPIVYVSQDATMAWMITRIHVRRTQTDADGNAEQQAFIYAGIMAYERRDGTWVQMANVSTFEVATT